MNYVSEQRQMQRKLMNETKYRKEDVDRHSNKKLRKTEWNWGNMPN